jgi:hypothetical protein
LKKYLNGWEGSRLPWVLLSVFLLGGMALRLYQLGKFGFWTDELLHVIGAKSLLESGVAAVPGKGEYTRAYPITILTAMMFKLFGESEAIARLPFVVINILFVLIGFIFVSKMFDKKIALIFSFFMAFSPFEMQMSRECRMYTTFQLLYFTGAMTFLAGMEPDVFRSFRRLNAFKRIDENFDINLFYLLISLALFLLSVYFHPLSFNFVFTALVYSLLMAFVVSTSVGILEAAKSKYSLLLLLLVCVAFSGLSIYIYVYSPNIADEIFDIAFTLPEWAEDTNAFSYYWDYFVNAYPFFIYSYMLSIFFAIRKYGKRGIFLFASFLPILFMHSFVYTGRISERYLFYVFPFFALGSSFIVCMIFDYLLEVLDAEYSERGYISAILLLFCLVPAVYLIGKPWMNEARKIHNKYSWNDWKSVSKELKAIPDDSVVIATRINTVYYYLGRMPDYNVRKSMFEISAKEVRSGNLDFSLHLILDLPTLIDKVKSSKDVYFLADRWSFNLPGYLDKEMREFITANFVQVKHGGSNNIIILRHNGQR